MQIIYNSEVIQVHIERSKRKTLCLSINKDGSVMVKAPFRIPTDDQILQIAEQKAEWILKQRNRMQEREEQRIERRFETGYSFPYLGEERSLELQYGKKLSIVYKEGKFVIETPYVEEIGKFYKTDIFIEKEIQEHIEKLRKELKKWYKKQAKDYIFKRVEYYRNIVDVSVTSVSIKSRKSQWGSCDSNGDITFSWRLVMARPEAIDYVVVHELCHRRHMDHSRAFWQEVEHFMPDYEQQKQWLEDHSVNLNI